MSFAKSALGLSRFDENAKPAVYLFAGDVYTGLMRIISTKTKLII